ncbi:MAG: hypothetical protein SVV03_05725 [Candidatus Nanohaloarchaea archaeon]|nr:hypothetical protein [Candidatus Nanohaloarchaea archaeon]
MDYTGYVRKKLSKYGYETIEWRSKEKKEKVRKKHGVDPKEILKLLKAGDYKECFPNPSPRDYFDYEESFIVRLKDKNSKQYEVVLYFMGDKVIIATAY